MIDSRLTGETAEDIYLGLLNLRGVFAGSFDTHSFDGIIFDTHNKYFKVGCSPFYVQIKCRGSAGDNYNTQGFPPEKISAIRRVAQKLGIPETSLYFVIGFYKNNDIRNVIYYTVPFSSLQVFKTSGQYRFSVKRCQDVMRDDDNIFCL